MTEKENKELVSSIMKLLDGNDTIPSIMCINEVLYDLHARLITSHKGEKEYTEEVLRAIRDVAENMIVTLRSYSNEVNKFFYK